MKLGCVESWYPLDVRLSLNLLHSYVNGVEEKIQIYIDRFPSGRTQESIVYDDEQGISRKLKKS
jgi:hypothetical protein